MPPTSLDVEDGDVPLVKIGSLATDPNELNEFGYSYRRTIGLTAPLNALDIFGVGVGLFFQCLIYLAAVYFVMFVVTVPVTVYNVKSNGGKLTGSWMVITSLVGEAQTVHGVSDLVAVLLFLASGLLLSYLQVRKTRKIQQNTYTAANYSVVVTGLPQDVQDVELKEHFGKYGEIFKIVVVDQNGAVLAAMMERKECREILWEYRVSKSNDPSEPNPSRLMRWGQSLGYWRDLDYYERRAEELDKVVDNKAAQVWFGLPSAVVTFNTLDATRDCLKDYAGLTLLDSLAVALCPCCTTLPVFRGKLLTVYAAPEPSDIIWGNLEYGRTSRVLRLCVTALVSIVTIVGVSGALTLFSFWEQDNVVKKDAKAARFEAVLFSFVIFIVNKLVVAVIRLAANFEHHHSKSGLHLAYVLKAFIWLYLNSLQGCFVWIYSEYRANRGAKIAEPSEAWVGVVGQLIYHVLFLDLAMYLVLSFLIPLWKSYTAADKAKRAQNARDRARILAGPPFDIEAGFARVLKICFIGLTFSTGLPFLLLFVAVELAIVFWVEKYKLLRVCNRPPMVDHTLPAMTDQILPVAAIIHAAIAVSLFWTTPALIFAFVEGGFAIACLFPALVIKALQSCGCIVKDDIHNVYASPKFSELEGVEAYVLPTKEEVQRVNKDQVMAKLNSYQPPEVRRKSENYSPQSAEELAAQIKAERGGARDSMMRPSSVYLEMSKPGGRSSIAPIERKYVNPYDRSNSTTVTALGGGRPGAPSSSAAGGGGGGGGGQGHRRESEDLDFLDSISGPAVAPPPSSSSAQSSTKSGRGSVMVADKRQSQVPITSGGGGAARASLMVSSSGGGGGGGSVVSQPKRGTARQSQMDASTKDNDMLSFLDEL